jgi:hypothetical protein
MANDDELAKACQKVGRFLHDFALVEREINRRIADILDLKGRTADVVLDGLEIPFFKKVDLLAVIALETAPDLKEQRKIRKLISSIAEQNINRIVMAHSAFEPTQGEAVQFRRTVAKKGKLTVQDPLWTKQQFEQASATLMRLQDKLRELKPRLTIKISSERSEMLTHYLYTAAQTWVPTGVPSKPTSNTS